jgi:hypothetical protein
MPPRGAIAADGQAGRRGIALVGSAGTVMSGAIDPLARLAEVAAANDLWFHVDGAYGALAALAEPARFDGLALSRLRLPRSVQVALPTARLRHPALPPRRGCARCLLVHGGVRQDTERRPDRGLRFLRGDARALAQVPGAEGLALTSVPRARSVPSCGRREPQASGLARRPDRGRAVVRAARSDRAECRLLPLDGCGY